MTPPDTREQARATAMERLISAGLTFDTTRDYWTAVDVLEALIVERDAEHAAEVERLQALRKHDIEAWQKEAAEVATLTARIEAAERELETRKSMERVRLREVAARAAAREGDLTPLVESEWHRISVGVNSPEWCSPKETFALCIKEAFEAGRATYLSRSPVEGGRGMVTPSAPAAVPSSSRGRGERIPVDLLAPTPPGMRCCRLATKVRDEEAKPVASGSSVYIWRCPNHGDGYQWEEESEVAATPETRDMKTREGM